MSGLIVQRKNNWVSLKFPSRFSTVLISATDFAALLAEMRTPDNDAQTELRALDELLEAAGDGKRVSVAYFRDYIARRLSARQNLTNEEA
ncbi:hypothetical protein ACFWP5_08925 [Streptomyces sp. NPDC058469]|uniref:hypothetical protein n=1 Tax=Streptomyces sp. NPDC058469 TaxID=3346514 RepID=UPI00365680B6